MNEPLILTPGNYAKLGLIHCGVLKDPIAIRAGDRVAIPDGGSHRLGRARVTVARQGDEYRFVRD